MKNNKSPDLVFTKLSESNLVSDFDCEEVLLNDFINKEAVKFQEERLGITYLVYTQSQLIGFVTISMAHIKTQKMHLDDKLKIQIENYPALQIGQIGIRKSFQRKGLGRRIIKWCMSEAIKYSEKIGCRILVLNSLPTSIGFYEHCNFVPLNGQEKRKQIVMYLVIPKELF